MGAEWRQLRVPTGNQLLAERTQRVADEVVAAIDGYNVGVGTADGRGRQVRYQLRLVQFGWSDEGVRALREGCVPEFHRVLCRGNVVVETKYGEPTTRIPQRYVERFRKTQLPQIVPYKFRLATDKELMAFEQEAPALAQMLTANDYSARFRLVD